MTLNYFYEQIMARLTEKVPEIKHIDLYFKQDEKANEEDELPFNTPAVLFEYDPMDYETYGNKKKAANATFKLHVISTVIQEVDNRTAPAIRVLGHAHLALIDKIDFNLQGFNGVGFNSIGSTGIIPYEPNVQDIKHIMLFKSRLTNDAAKHTLVVPNPLPSLDATVSNETTPS